MALATDQLHVDMDRLLGFLLHQGFLDEHFLRLQDLEDETAPDFVEEVVNIYFHETEKLLKTLHELLTEKEETKFERVQVCANRMAGSSSSIGAKRIRNVCIALRCAAEQANRSGCLRALGVLQEEYCYLKHKLQTFFQMKQARALGAGAGAGYMVL